MQERGEEEVVIGAHARLAAWEASEGEERAPGGIAQERRQRKTRGRGRCFGGEEQRRERKAAVRGRKRKRVGLGY